MRQALHDLVDYEGMANSFLKGQFSVHETFWPSGFWASLDKNEYAFDPAKAKALLAEGGYPNGLDVTLDTPNSSPYLTIAQSIQATMAQAGVKVTLVPKEQKALLTEYRARGHQMLLVYWGPGYMDPPPTPTPSRATRTIPTMRSPSRSPGATLGTFRDHQDGRCSGARARFRQARGMYKELQAKVMDEGPFIVMFQETKRLAERSNVGTLCSGRRRTSCSIDW